MNNQGRAALITGSSRGIGAGIALVMAEEGYSYIGINYAFDEEGAKQTAEECRKLGAEVKTFQANVADKHDCKKLLDEFIAWAGKIDVLVNNAGGALKVVNKGRGFDEITLEYWDEQIALNLSAAAYCSHYAMKDMKARGIKGNIIHTSSVMSYGAWDRKTLLPYSAAKAGLNEFTCILANECAPLGIRVNAVAPGFIVTPTTNARYTDEERAVKLKKIPLHSFGEPRDIANAVAFLADNEKARYIVGQVLLVDGGFGADRGPVE